MFIAPNEIGDLERYLEEYHIDSFEDLEQVLAEYQQIIEYIPKARELQKEVVDMMRKGLIFHIFGDKKDDWVYDPLQALESYLKYRAEGHTCTRLYYEVHDREGDTETEDCLISFGEYPS